MQQRRHRPGNRRRSVRNVSPRYFGVSDSQQHLGAVGCGGFALRAEQHLGAQLGYQPRYRGTRQRHPRGAWALCAGATTSVVTRTLPLCPHSIDSVERRQPRCGALCRASLWTTGRRGRAALATGGGFRPDRSDARHPVSRHSSARTDSLDEARVVGSGIVRGDRTRVSASRTHPKGCTSVRTQRRRGRQRHEGNDHSDAARLPARGMLRRVRTALRETECAARSSGARISGSSKRVGMRVRTGKRNEPCPDQAATCLDPPSGANRRGGEHPRGWNEMCSGWSRHTEGRCLHLPGVDTRGFDRRQGHTRAKPMRGGSGD
jgi:hypothetical protein